MEVLNREFLVSNQAFLCIASTSLDTTSIVHYYESFSVGQTNLSYYSGLVQRLDLALTARRLITDS
jgi:hypothetical protein